MRLIVIFILLVIAAKILEEGFIPALFIVGLVLWLLIGRDKKSQSIENFFAMVFFLAVVGVAVQFVSVLV